MYRFKTETLMGFIALSMVVLFTSSAFAVNYYKRSALNGGEQIWIEAGDFDQRDADENIKKVAEAEPEDQGEGYLAENNNGISINVPQEKLGQVVDFEISKEEAFVKYNFKVDKASQAFGYARCADLRPDGGQSLWLALNVDEGGGALSIDTQDDWTWLGGKFSTDLVAGENTLMVAKREGDERGAVIVDIIVVSTVEFTPTDVLFNQAQTTSVEPKGKLATTWGDIKWRY